MHSTLYYIGANYEGLFNTFIFMNLCTINLVINSTQLIISCLFPFKKAAPAVGFTSPTIMLNAVVLPAPLTPSNPKQYFSVKSVNTSFLANVVYFQHKFFINISHGQYTYLTPRDAQSDVIHGCYTSSAFHEVLQIELYLEIVVIFCQLGGFQFH